MKVSLAILAGFFCSFGSMFGKSSNLFNAEETSTFWYASTVIVCLISMILCNVFGMFFFTKSLHQTESSIVATLISTSCNYVLSGIFGAVLFDEIISIYWLCGTTLAIIGLYLIVTDSSFKPKSS